MPPRVPRRVTVVATERVTPNMVRVVFGGPGLDTLYVTSASDGLGPEALAREPLAGGLFRCWPGFRGVPPDLFAD